MPTPSKVACLALLLSACSGPRRSPTESCEDGLTPCDDECVDLEEDPANCGSCGTACGADETCVSGECLTGCVDRCTGEGESRCDPEDAASIQLCGDDDADGCLEWGPSILCPGGSTCAGPGACGGGADADVDADTDVDGGRSFTAVRLPEFNLNLRWGAMGEGTFTQLFPGTHVWNGVPFALEVDAAGRSAWGAPSSTTTWLDIPVGVFGVTQAYTIINSYYGIDGWTVGSVEFFGGAGSYHVVPLIEGLNIRDCAVGSHLCDTLDGVTATSAFSDGQVRLDMQIFALPEPFADETLTWIRLNVRVGSLGEGDPFIVAATVEATGS